MWSIAFKLLVEKPEYGWVDNIKMDLKFYEVV
jgi:hypothetical protein